MYSIILFQSMEPRRKRKEKNSKNWHLIIYEYESEYNKYEISYVVLRRCLPLSYKRCSFVYVSMTYKCINILAACNPVRILISANVYSFIAFVFEHRAIFSVSFLSQFHHCIVDIVWLPFLCIVVFFLSFMNEI